jgi:hypothetical protein
LLGYRGRDDTRGAFRFSPAQPALLSQNVAAECVKGCLVDFAGCQEATQLPGGRYQIGKRLLGGTFWIEAAPAARALKRNEKPTTIGAGR